MLTRVCVCVFCQIENANDVLILPLERFRKEQISAAKVSEVTAHVHMAGDTQYLHKNSGGVSSAILSV